MREKGGKAGKEEKIIRRELACVLTGGTLVDESMLQDEMATYCVAIKVQFWVICRSGSVTLLTWANCPLGIVCRRGAIVWHSFC